MHGPASPVAATEHLGSRNHGRVDDGDDACALELHPVEGEFERVVCHVGRGGGGGGGVREVCPGPNTGKTVMDLKKRSWMQDAFFPPS